MRELISLWFTAGALALLSIAACSPDTALPSSSAGDVTSAAGVGGSVTAGKPSAPAAVGGSVAPASGAVAGTPAQVTAGMRGGDRGPRNGQGQNAGGGRPGSAPSTPNSGAAGTSASAAGNAAQPVSTAGAAAAGSGAGAGTFEAERQACVDTINMYRATLNLAPYTRASKELEACSDMGAKKDGDANAAHSSAGDCRPLGAQNTCPGYPARNGDVTASLKMCLAQMWGEGEPPMGVDACIKDTAGCFQMHGHWINMQSASSKQVACGFYKMADGRYWMNQNFGR